MGNYLEEELYGLIRNEGEVFDFFHESLLDGFWCWDLNNPQNGWVDKKFWNLLGYKSEEIVEPASVIFNSIHQDDLLAAKKNLKQHIRNPQIPFDQVVRLIHKDGSIVWVHSRGLIVRDSDGKPCRFIGAQHDITELKLTEKVLLRSIEKSVANEDNLKVQLKLNQNLVQSIPIPVYIKNKDGLYLDCNMPFEIITGRAKNEIVGKTVFDIWSPDLATVYYEKDQEIISSGGTLIYEGIVRDKDGCVKNVIFSKNTFVDENGDVAGIIGAFLDITERTAYERELIRAKESAEESEYRFKASFVTSPDSISINSMDGVFVDVNEGFCALSGYKREEVIGKLSTEVQIWGSEDERDRWVELLKKDGCVKNFESNFRKKNGELVPGLISTSIIKLNNEPHTLSVTREITERKRYEDELIKAKEKAELSEHKLRLQNNEIELNNERLESLLRISQLQINSIQELLDYALEEAIKLTSSKIGYIYFYDESKRQFVLNTWSKEVMKECAVMNPQQVYDLDRTGCWGEVVRQRKPIIINDYHAENPYKKGTPQGHVQLEKFLSIPVMIDGKIVAVAGVANKTKDYDKSDVRQLTLLMDNVWKISERITLIENLKIAKEKAEESDRLKTAFLHNMSHEIRTPMNAIMGFSELLYMNYKEDPKLAHFSKIINQRCNDLLVIIDDILDIAKIESGQYPLKIERCNLNVLFKDLNIFFKEHQVKMEKQHIGFDLKVNHNGCLFLETDTVKLKQIFINLIGNAFKFTDQGEILAGFTIKEEGFLEFFVSDTGIGIPSEKHQEIFVRFAQLEHQKNRMYGGTGLGLSIVKGLVELLGGTIWVESEPGKGSTFFFTHPYREIVPVTKEDQVKPEKIEIPANKLILLVDDDLYNISLIEELLGEKNIQLVSATNGTEAIKYYVERTPDLVLMDIGLPDINGFEVIQKLKHMNPSLKIVAQTAFAAPEDKQMAFDVGCCDYISKPLKAASLLSIINRHLTQPFVENSNTQS